jgi:hypothetical protein
VYGIPQQADGVLKIDPANQEYTQFGSGQLPRSTKFRQEGGWMWHGGMTSLDETIVYGFPNNSDHVLRIDTADDSISMLGGPDVLESGRHRVPQDGRYAAHAASSWVCSANPSLLSSSLLFA